VSVIKQNWLVQCLQAQTPTQHFKHDTIFWCMKQKGSKIVRTDSYQKHHLHGECHWAGLSRSAWQLHLAGVHVRFLTLQAVDSKVN